MLCLFNSSHGLDSIGIQDIIQRDSWDRSPMEFELQLMWSLVLDGIAGPNSHNGPHQNSSAGPWTEFYVDTQALLMSTIVRVTEWSSRVVTRVKSPQISPFSFFLPNLKFVAHTLPDYLERPDLTLLTGIEIFTVDELKSYFGTG